MCCGTSCQVSHPNVARVYDVGEIEGHTFLSMEYIDGEDLGTLLRRIGRFPGDRAVQIAREICAGLAAAHDRGVLHHFVRAAAQRTRNRKRVRLHHRRRRHLDRPPRAAPDLELEQALPILGQALLGSFERASLRASTLCPGLLLCHAQTMPHESASAPGSALHGV